MDLVVNENPASFGILFAMVGKRAILLLQEAWLRMNLHQFFATGEPRVKNNLVVLKADVLDAQGSYGLFVKIIERPDLGDSQVFIPWKYVEGIFWNDDPSIIKRFGFATDESTQ